jgi:soluble lytic murein transglycosylase
VADPELGFRSAIEAYRAGDTGTAVLTARAVAEHHSESPWYKRSLFLTLQALIRADRPEEADAAMLRIRAEYPEMADYALSLLADYHFTGRRFTQAAALYHDLVEAYPKSSLATRAAFRRGQSLLEASAYPAAVDVLDLFVRTYPRSEHAPDAGLGLGRALVAEARLAEAVRVYRSVWVSYPGTPADQEAVKALGELAVSGVDVAPWTVDEWYERGSNLFRTGQYAKGLESFLKLLELDPKTPHRAQALFRIGVSQFNLGRRGDAAVALEKMVTEHPHDQSVPEALYWAGRSYSRMGERERGIRTFARILDSFPESEWADDALFLTGNIYREANDMKKALTFYSRLASEYPDSRFADSSIWWRAWSYYAAGEYSRTEQTLQELVIRYPKSFLVNQALYWQGRTAERTGQTGKARVYFGKVLKRGPYTYYGYRAAERLGTMDGTSAVVNADPAPEVIPACAEESCIEDPLFSFETDDGPPVWTEDARRLLSAEPSFRKTLELMHLDLRKEAAAELWFLQERIPRKRGLLIGLSKAFFELGDYYRSLVLVIRNYERYLDGEVREIPGDLWLLAYPQGYWDSILAYARKYGQDPYFIAAIIRAESQFHAEALSPAGARGVMQVMPSTGEWIAQTIRLQGFDGGKLFDSDTAINLGTWYISHLMKRFKNDPLLVAAAYNAGPEAVNGWLARNGPVIERDEFVEFIPFSETRGYVKKVLRNYAEYKRIYGRTGQAPAAVPLPVTGGTAEAMLPGEPVKTP